MQDLGSLGDLVLPTLAGEAVVDAMLHAVTASALHATGATRRSIRMSELGPDGLRVVIADDGAAFDPADSAQARAVLHRAAAELMRSVDGRADIRSGSEGGTVVTLSWGSVVVSGTGIRPERAEVPA